MTVSTLQMNIFRGNCFPFGKKCITLHLEVPCARAHVI